MRMTSILLYVGIVIAALATVAWWYALVVPGRSHVGPLPPATSDGLDAAVRLRRHVVATASVPHNIKNYEALERAAKYIEATLEGLGYSVSRQNFTVAGHTVRNIEVEREAQMADAPTLVVGAHYDSFENAPGANDNGSGVAAILELARLLKEWQPSQKSRRDDPRAAVRARHLVSAQSSCLSRRSFRSCILFLRKPNDHCASILNRSHFPSSPQV